MDAQETAANPVNPSTPTLSLLTELLQGLRRPAVFGTDQGAVLCMNGAATQSIDRKPGETRDVIPADWPRRLAIQIDGQTFHLAVPDPAPAVTPPSHLPPRLAKIARLVISGLTDKQIASHTGLSFSTVRTYVRQIYRSIGVNSRIALIYARL